MLIPRISHRHICATSFHNRLQSVDNAAFKRLFLKKTCNYLSVISSRKLSAYEGDGKTYGTVINKKRSDTLFISQYMSQGFVLPSGSELIGSLLIFPHAVMSWHVSNAKDITEESLVLFKLIQPKIDILIFGYGNRIDYTPEVREKFTKYCKNLGLRFEALPTDQAVGTFNFLAEERRLVAGALIPPRHVDVFKFDRSKPVYLEDGEDEEEEEDLKTITGGMPHKKLIK